MANVEEKLPSGALLYISTSSMDDCDALFSALAKCTKGIPLTLDMLSQDATIVKDVLAEALSSVEVKSALWKCMTRATYNGVKITKQLFDDEKMGDSARTDYFLIVFHVIKVNCAPFFGQIFSMWKARLGSAAATPKQA